MDRRQSAAKLVGIAPTVDLCAELVVGDGRRCTDGKLRPGETLLGDTAWSNETTLIRVGGRWNPNAPAPDDGSQGYWSDDEPDTVVRYRLHRGQEPAARLFADWLRRYTTGDWVGVGEGQRLFELLLRGGRRGGKTHAAGVFVVLLCVAMRRRIVHALSAINDTSVELIALLSSLMPAEWYGGKMRQRKNRPPEFVLANGSVIRMLSGKAYRKQGRADMALLNEMQDGFPIETYDKVRAPCADTGGLLLAAFNPADEADSLWVDEKFHAAMDGRIIGARAFQLIAKDNPLILHESLTAMASGMDARRKRRELDGEDVPIGDAVMIEWVAREHYVDPPSDWPDITAAFLAARGQPPASGFAGMDFQGSPFMSGRILRVYRSPTGLECPWVVGEADVEGDEHALSAALVKLGADPATWPAVIDASAWWQDGAHHEGRTSDRILRAAGWQHLLRPQAGSDRNPAVKIRIRNANRLLRSGTGVVLLRVATWCTRTAEAFTKYKRIRGEPARKSEHAHPVDATTYPLFRFFPPVESGPGALVRAAAGETPRAQAMSAIEADRARDGRGPRVGRSRSGRDAGW